RRRRNGVEIDVPGRRGRRSLHQRCRLGIARLGRDRLHQRHYVVTNMSKFTDVERTEILRKSREILERGDEPPPREEPRKENPRTFWDEPRESAQERWAREADEREAERQAARERMRREEREVVDGAWNDFWGEIDRRIQSALAEQREQIIDLIGESVRAVGDFADSVTKKLDQLERDRDHLHDDKRPLDLPS